MSNEELYEEDDENDVEYSAKSEFSKAAIVAESIRETRKARGCEMREGYHNYKFSRDGEAVKVWIPDTRKIFVSNVEGDLSLLSHEISRNERMREVLKVLGEKKMELFQKYCYCEKVREGYAWKLTGKEWLPKIDEELPVQDPAKPKSKSWVFKKGLWNIHVNRYWDEMLELYDKVFGELNYLIADNNYFKSGARFG